MAVCNKCGSDKPPEDFYKRKNRPCGIMSECKDCIKGRMNHRYKEDPKRVLDMSAARRYNTTIEHIQQLREDADGICQICGNEGKAHYKRLVIDHDHETGKIRGCICSNCNSILGYCKDDPLVLQNLINYLNDNINTTTTGEGLV